MPISSLIWFFSQKCCEFVLTSATLPNLSNVLFYCVSHLAPLTNNKTKQNTTHSSSNSNSIKNQNRARNVIVKPRKKSSPPPPTYTYNSPRRQITNTPLHQTSTTNQYLDIPSSLPSIHIHSSPDSIIRSSRQTWKDEPSANCLFFFIRTQVTRLRPIFLILKQNLCLVYFV